MSNHNSQTQALQNIRQYSTEAQVKKSGLSNGLLLGLFGAGIVGGIAYKSQGKTSSLKEGNSASAFESKGFVSLKVE